MKDSRLKVLDFKTTKEPIKVLGINLSYNSNKCVEENFFVKIKKMKTKFNLWLSSDLTIYGKSLLAKALGISQLVYAASMLTVPESVVKTVQENLFAFLWKNRKDKMKRVVMYQTVEKGECELLIFARLLKRYVWLGLVDYCARLTINGRQSPTITFENMEAYYFFSNAIMI